VAVLPRYARAAALLLGALLTAVAGCGQDVVVRVDERLWVVSTYPASGSEVQREAARELRLLFSRPLGETGADQAVLSEHVLLDAAPDADAPWAPVPIASFEARDADSSLVVRPQADALLALPAGAELRLSVTAGLAAGGGSEVARDQLFHFRLAGEP